jgi:hypothetical protein
VKAADLIAILQTFPADTPVVMPGHASNGYNHVNRAEAIEVVKAREPGGAYGEFEKEQMIDRTVAVDADDSEKVDAILIDWNSID